MTAFLIAALLLLVLTSLFLLRPLLRGGSRMSVNVAAQREVNQGILRDQLADLEQERLEGSLIGAEFEQARDELKRRILEETNAEVVVSGNSAPAPKTAGVVVLTLLLGASLGYAFLGNPLALDPAQLQARPQMTPEQIEGMVEKLAARMEANPEDEQGWVMLARSYKVMGRLPEAAKAYAHAEKLVATDANLLSDYAEVLAMSSETGLKGKPSELVAQAIKLDPLNPHALFLAGAVAMESGQPKQAIVYWEKLLPLLEPGSETETLLKSSIEKIRGQMTIPAP